MNKLIAYRTIPCDTLNIIECCVETESQDEICAMASSKSEAHIIRQLSNTKAIVECLHCGKEFETYYCKIRAGRGRYCSIRCRNVAHGVMEALKKTNPFFSEGANAGKNNSNWGGGDFIDCEICGKPFWKYPSRKTATCSHKCGCERGRLVRLGLLQTLGNRNYYNGIKGWKYLRIITIERDNFICQGCNTNYKEQPQFLHAHHKVYLSNGGKNEVSNLITLCKDCHFKLHTISGDLRKR